MANAMKAKLSTVDTMDMVPIIIQMDVPIREIGKTIKRMVMAKKPIQKAGFMKGNIKMTNDMVMARFTGVMEKNLKDDG